MANGDVTTYDSQQERMFEKQDTNPLNPNLRSLYLEPLEAGKVRVNPQRKWYADAQNELRAINIDLAEENDAGNINYKCDTNTVRTEVKDAGEVWYRMGPYGLRVRLARAHLEDSGGSDIGGVDAVAGTHTHPETNKVKVTQAVGSNLEFEYEVVPGGVKEYITILTKPNLGSSDKFAIVWDYQTIGLQAETNNTQIRWFSMDTGKKEPRFTFKTLAAWDADGNELPVQYRLTTAQSKFAVVMLSADLENAAYPVVIDPTIETDEDEGTVSRGVRDPDYDTLGTHAYEYSLAKFTMPDLPGATITGNTLNIRQTSAPTDYTNVTFDIFADTESTTLTTTTNHATMRTIATTEITTEVLSNQTGQAGTGWLTYSLGDLAHCWTNGTWDGNLILNFYWDGTYDHSTPSTTQAANNQIIGENPGAYGKLEFNPTTHGTNYSYIEVTYTAPSLSSVDASESASCGDDLGAGDTNYEWAMALFDLPDMTGNTVLGGRVYFYRQTGSGSGQLFDVYAKIATTSWTSTSNASTLETVGSELGSALQTNQQKDENSEWTSFDITGAAGTSGILNAYNGTDDPGNFTVALKNPSAITSDREDANFLAIGDDGSGPWVQFEDDLHVTLNPYLEVFYETAGGGIATHWIHYNKMRSAS